MRMNLLKDAAEIKAELNLSGVYLETVYQDGVLTELRLDIPENESRFVIKVAATYSNEIGVYEVLDYEEKKVHQVTGSLLGIGISENFEDQYEAKARAEKIIDAGGEVEVKEVTIRVRDGDCDPFPATSTADDDLPF